MLHEFLKIIRETINILQRHSHLLPLILTGMKENSDLEEQQEIFGSNDQYIYMNLDPKIICG